MCLLLNETLNQSISTVFAYICVLHGLGTAWCRKRSSTLHLSFFQDTNLKNVAQILFFYWTLVVLVYRAVTGHNYFLS